MEVTPLTGREKSWKQLTFLKQVKKTTKELTQRAETLMKNLTMVILMGEVIIIPVYELIETSKPKRLAKVAQGKIKILSQKK